MSKKPQTKKRADTKERQFHKDYAGTEASPYREWLDTRGIYGNESDSREPKEANPDNLSEEQSLYYQAQSEDPRLEIIQAVEKTLTDRQKEILRMCGNEGRTMENTAAILKISKGTVQKTLERIRQKALVLQKQHCRG